MLSRFSVSIILIRKRTMCWWKVSDTADIKHHVKIWFAIAAHFKSPVKSEQAHVKLLHYRQTRQFTMEEILDRQAIFLSM